jgi:hypothetical protein
MPADADSTTSCSLELIDGRGTSSRPPAPGYRPSTQPQAQIPARQRPLTDVLTRLAPHANLPALGDFMERLRAAA